jgi:uncharacterized coiled-coil DUF342 family protein
MLKQAFNTIMQSETIGKILQNEALVESILTAITSSLEARDAISARYEQMLKAVGLVTNSQLEEVKEALDMMSQEADALREQLTNSSANSRKLRQKAEEAEKQLAAAQAEIEELKLKLAQAEQSKVEHVQSKSNSANKAPAAKKNTTKNEDPQWSPTMTKKELIEVATDLGLKVSNKLKKTDLIDRLKKLG